VSIPVPCDRHLIRHYDLQVAVRKYRMAIRDETRRGSPKKDLLDPDVKQRIEEFETDCVEDLWIERETIIGRYLDCWGTLEDRADESEFKAHIQTCIDRLQKAASVFKEDSLLRCNTSVRDQPPVV
jgi:hypothetical protein